MSDFDATDTPVLSLAEPPEQDAFEPALPRPRLKKLRLLFLGIPLLALAFVSAMFGMVMEIAQDLPGLENEAQYNNAKNSVLYDDQGHEIGIISDPQDRVLVSPDQIAPIMKDAIVSVEDKRFYTNDGVDLRGMVRAVAADLLHQGGTQGASTITEQFVKNALAAQGKRTVFEKIREAAIAFHLTREWKKDKILTEYLNTIYFGNGAYGIESAARTYFGNTPGGAEYMCGTPGHPLCVTLLTAPQAALLAGLVASPSAFDPVVNPNAARARRNLVLQDMEAQGYLTQAEYAGYIGTALPSDADILPPEDKTVNPSLGYYLSWIRQQVIDKYGAQRAFDGGLRIRTTLDPDMQKAAVAAVGSYITPNVGPQAALVAIDNSTGELRAMVGGNNYNTTPFNLATQGERQPGSSFKTFVLAEALIHGISPYSVWPSQPRTFNDPVGHDVFKPANDEATYVGSRTLTSATTYSDNSVFAAVGIQGIGHCCRSIARLAQRMGIRTPISHNYAITIGGLHTGVTPIDMAHAYETLEHNGERVSGTMVPLDSDNGPVGIQSVTPPRGPEEKNHVVLTRVLPAWVAQTEQGMLRTVITQGTGTNANFGVWEAGKTGTTDHYGDAWFVGFTHQLTVAVWVGYPSGTKSMATDYYGQPVMGGTFPALIWRGFMESALNILAAEHSGSTGATGVVDTTAATPSSSTTSTTSSSPAPTGSTSNATTGSGSSGGGSSSGSGSGGGSQPTTPSAPTTPQSPTTSGSPAQQTQGGAGASSPGAAGGASAPPG